MDMFYKIWSSHLAYYYHYDVKAPMSVKDIGAFFLLSKKAFHRVIQRYDARVLPKPNSHFKMCLLFRIVLVLYVTFIYGCCFK